MMMCNRCNQRPAVVFVTKVENGEKKIEGVVTEIDNGDGTYTRYLKVYAWWEKNTYNVNVTYNDYNGSNYQSSNSLSNIGGYL